MPMLRQAFASALLAFTAGMSGACQAPEQGGSVEIYPTAQVLPANLLRMYVYFPRPMAREGILDHIALRDANGEEIDGVFLSNRFDLWSPDYRRLTLLLDPGRVKTGLAAHAAMGRALEEGAQYAFSVAGTAPDAQGCPLGAGVAYAFTAGPADIVPPSPESWALTIPAAGSRAPLNVDLGDTHDHLSMAYRIRVQTADGAPVAGRIALGPAERAWIFTPGDPWERAEYRLVVDERLEDLAGNRPGGMFDRPVGSAGAAWLQSRSWIPKSP